MYTTLFVSVVRGWESETVRVGWVLWHRAYLHHFNTSFDSREFRRMVCRGRPRWLCANDDGGCREWKKKHESHFPVCWHSTISHHQQRKSLCKSHNRTIKNYLSHCEVCWLVCCLCAGDICRLGFFPYLCRGRRRCKTIIFGFHMPVGCISTPTQFPSTLP